MATQSDWAAAPLGELLVDGPTNGYSPQASDDATGTWSFKLSATTSGRFIINDQTKKRLHETIAPDSKYWLKPGDLLVQRSNTLDYVGTAAIYEGPPDSYIYPDTMMRLRFSEPDTTRWVWRYLNGPRGREYFRKVAGGAASSMSKISGAKLRELTVPLPPLPEQKRIAAILDKADAIRRKRQESIRLTEELLRSAFLEMFGKYEDQSHSRPFADVCEILVDCRNKTAPYESAGRPLIRTTNFRNNGLDLTEVKCVSDATNKIWSARHQTAPGDIVYCREAPFGMAAIVPEDFYPCLGQRIMVARANPSVVRHQYLWAALNSRYVYHQADRVAVGATVKHLRVRDVEQLLVPVPPLVEQDRFCDVHRQQAQVGVHGAVFGDLSENFQGALTQRAFSGRL